VRRTAIRSAAGIHLALECRNVMEAIGARGSGNDVAPPPFAQRATDVLACHAGQRRQTALADLLLQHDGSREFSPTCCTNSSKARATRPLTDRKVLAARLVGLPQPGSQDCHQRPVGFRMRLHDLRQGLPAGKSELAVAQRDDRCRSRQPADHCELADDRAGALPGVPAPSASSGSRVALTT
jgi:hypothetical protein